MSDSFTRFGLLRLCAECGITFFAARQYWCGRRQAGPTSCPKAMLATRLLEVPAIRAWRTATKEEWNDLEARQPLRTEARERPRNRVRRIDRGLARQEALRQAKADPAVAAADKARRAAHGRWLASNYGARKKGEYVKKEK